MKDKKLALIDENNSPLFRIMSVYNLNGNNIAFANNVCAFHIGDGIVISVAHNLRGIDPLPILLSDAFFVDELSIKLSAPDLALFDKHYNPILGSGKRVFNAGGNQPLIDQLVKILDDAKVDRRFCTLHFKGCCKPHLLASFRNNSFCNETSLVQHFSPTTSFHEADLNRYTFLIELELLKECVNEDIAIYKIVNSHTDIIARLPAIEVDYELYDIGTENYYCLQSAPFDHLGRIINEARIEGILDNYSREKDRFDNLYVLDGHRYLIKGYFRFGSSGAPYLIYDKDAGKFKVNAVQSQASFVQLSIEGKMDGNVQYVNGIASPLALVKTQLTELIDEMV